MAAGMFCAEALHLFYCPFRGVLGINLFAVPLAKCFQMPVLVAFGQNQGILIYATRFKRDERNPNAYERPKSTALVLISL